VTELDPSLSTPLSNSDIDHDLASIDGLLQALYEAVSFPSGGAPKWPRVRVLFTPEARLSRVAKTGIQGTTLDDLVDRVERAIAAGGLQAFCEREIARRTDVFGGIAQVFSTCEREFETVDTDGDHCVSVRGVNSIQLFRDRGRWWINAMLWTDEGEGVPLPAAYLPRG